MSSVPAASSPPVLSSSAGTRALRSVAEPRFCRLLPVALTPSALISGLWNRPWSRSCRVPPPLSLPVANNKGRSYPSRCMSAFFFPRWLLGCTPYSTKRNLQLFSWTSGSCGSAGDISRNVFWPTLKGSPDGRAAPNPPRGDPGDWGVPRFGG